MKMKEIETKNQAVLLLDLKRIKKVLENMVKKEKKIIKSKKFI
jgi:hypothetical protein